MVRKGDRLRWGGKPSSQVGQGYLENQGQEGSRPGRREKPWEGPELPQQSEPGGDRDQQPEVLVRGRTTAAPVPLGWARVGLNSVRMQS